MNTMVSMSAPENNAWLHNTDLIGGAGCLDFINSVSNRFSKQPREHLLSFADLLAWLQRCGLLQSAARRKLLGASKRDTNEAEIALQSALRCRDATWRVLSEYIRGRKASDADLDIINHAIDSMHAHMKLAQSHGRFEFRYTEFCALESVLWPAARDIALLLTSNDLGLVRLCAGQDCGWLFIDRSRSHKRRWCSMRDCGNRAKVRAHYQRQKRSPVPSLSRA